MTTERDVRIVITDWDFDALPDDWESLVSAGLSIVEAHDRNRWALGDLGGRVARKYGEGSLRTFAHEVKVRPATMYEYCRVSEFYPREMRSAFPSLSWSHFREALRLKSFEAAYGALCTAAADEMSVQDLRDWVTLELGEPTNRRGEKLAVKRLVQE